MKTTKLFQNPTKPKSGWLKRLGQVGLLFFLAKGLLWLAVPLVLVMVNKS